MTLIQNSGWELYADAQYTVGSQLALPANTNVKLTIDGNGVLTRTTQAVAGMGPLWDVINSHALHFLPDQLTSYRLFMIVTPAGVDQLLDIKMRQVGGVINYVTETVRLAKGAGTPQSITRWLPIFADDGSVANGVEIILNCSGAATVYGATILCINEHIPGYGS